MGVNQEGKSMQILLQHLGLAHHPACHTFKKSNAARAANKKVENEVDEWKQEDAWSFSQSPV